MAIMAKKKPPTIPVYVRMPKAIKRAIEELAEEHRRPMATEILIALEEYLEKHDKWPPGGKGDED